ncbi:amyloid beta a4 precursor protein-binding family a member 1-like [Plakobranchus ocellatus]|uniref:Amyloid beta a4 protein-binding family a member 1-like n=1 Tax=Plakobranchus ocellatus TaxID=259542 RepID=A0AAV3YN24_9GAST|nr:amyloid beta a4 precursor protein-binding family a member 1-like [Plakobranchus ocellatus]
MSMKEKSFQSVIESDEENESGACGITPEPRHLSLAIPEPGYSGVLDESVDNLSMEVHLGEDGSRHPSEISSVSYQNLLDDAEPSNSVVSRRGSDDSLDSYPPEFPDSEVPPDELETFEAQDLPLSEHFPMGALQAANDRSKSLSDRHQIVSEKNPNLSQPHVRLKDSTMSFADNVTMRAKSLPLDENQSKSSKEEVQTKRSSLEIRNNIPVMGEVKDYEKDLNLSKIQGAKAKMVGVKQSPGLARRVDLEAQEDSGGLNENSATKLSSTLSSQAHRTKTKTNSTKPKDKVVEVITPIPKNLNIENEYDYVKYARVQQGNSYVGMRLAYSSSNDSLNIKQTVGSDCSSRELSPEKNIQQKTLESQEPVMEDTLTEIPLNNSDFSEDKKAFTLSPENTECDSVEVDSVTSEGENSIPGFPTVEDGLSSSQASDVDDGAVGHSRPHCSPSKMLQAKQKANLEEDLFHDDLEKDPSATKPKEMDAQAIMDDLKMKREALDMAIADIKSAIQRSKSMSLEAPYPSQQEVQESQPVWIKRENKEAVNQAHCRQEEMRRVRDEIEKQQEKSSPSQGKGHQEKEMRECEQTQRSSRHGKHFEAISPSLSDSGLEHTNVDVSVFRETGVNDESQGIESSNLDQCGNDHSVSPGDSTLADKHASSNVALSKPDQASEESVTDKPSSLSSNILPKGLSQLENTLGMEGFNEFFKPEVEEKVNCFSAHLQSRDFNTTTGSIQLNRNSQSLCEEEQIQTGSVHLRGSSIEDTAQSMEDPCDEEGLQDEDKRIAESSPDVNGSNTEVEGLQDKRVLSNTAVPEGSPDLHGSNTEVDGLQDKAILSDTAVPEGSPDLHGSNTEVDGLQDKAILSDTAVPESSPDLYGSNTEVEGLQDKRVLSNTAVPEGSPDLHGSNTEVEGIQDKRVLSNTAVPEGSPDLHGSNTEVEGIQDKAILSDTTVPEGSPDLYGSDTEVEGLKDKAILSDTAVPEGSPDLYGSNTEVEGLQIEDKGILSDTAVPEGSPDLHGSNTEVEGLKDKAILSDTAVPEGSPDLHGSNTEVEGLQNASHDEIGLVGNIQPDGKPRGYDSDDECEDAEGIRYTRRNKGKKYALLQKDDSLETGGAHGGSRESSARANGHMFTNSRGSHSGSNGAVANRMQAFQSSEPSGEHHIRCPEGAAVSSEESSDIEAAVNSYTRALNADSDTDEETDRLLQKQYQERDKHVEIPELTDQAAEARKAMTEKCQSKAKEAAIRDPDRPEVLIEGVLFRARYLGSTQLISEGQPSKAMRMMQAQEAVGRIKAPEGESQPSTDVDLFVSTEKIMVLNTDLQEIMMDHSLRTISYIADIGDILVIMARRRLITSPDDMLGRRRRQAKILCHVFESDENLSIAGSRPSMLPLARLDEGLKARDHLAVWTV